MFSLLAFWALVDLSPGVCCPPPPPSPAPKKEKNVTLCVCSWQKWNVLHESRWECGPTSLAIDEFTLAVREGANIFCTSVIRL